jgi:hypothetical protein
MTALLSTTVPALPPDEARELAALLAHAARRVEAMYRRCAERAKEPR